MVNNTIYEMTEIGEYLDAMYEDTESGEVFFVELKREEGETVKEFITKCDEVAADYFDEPVFLGLIDSDSAETLGYDTY